MKIPYLIKKRLKSGEVAYYFNLPPRLVPDGCNIKRSYPLGLDYGKACQKAFELYNQLKNYKKYEENIMPKSLRHIWKDYIASRFYKKLSPDTAKGYTYTYNFLCNLKSGKTGKSFADIPLDSFSSSAAYNLYEKIVEKTGNIYKARYCITVLKMLYNRGIYFDILEGKNPFENLNISKPKAKKLLIQEEDRQQFIKLAYEKGKTHLALALELNDYLAQRGGDIRRLTGDNIKEYNNFLFFVFEQHKTGKQVYIPIPERLWDKVKNIKGYIIHDEFGGFSKDRLSRHFKKFSDEIGIKITFKQTRHTALTKYAEAGVRDIALKSISGHSKVDTLTDYYVADTPELALSAYMRRIESESQNEKPKQSEKY